MINKLVKVIEEENNFNNAIIPLSLDVKEVVFIYHHNINSNIINNCSKIIRKYKNINLSFVQIDADKIDELLTNDTYVDISASKYLSISLLKSAITKNLTIIYYDETENTIKEYNNHKILTNKIFNLKIEDIILLKNGKIKSNLHTPYKKKETIELINYIVENIKNYNYFIEYLNELKSILNCSKKEGKNYYYKENEYEKLLNNKKYQEFFNISLYENKNNSLIFENEEIFDIVSVPGTILENYIYYKLKNSNIFDDIVMSCKIEFNSEQHKYPVECEIDCLVLKDNKLLFVSIKSNNIVSSDLNEIKVHNLMFGNNFSKPVMCVRTNISELHPAIYGKAEELGIYMIDEDNFVNKNIVEVFKNILDNNYKYDRI